MAIRTRVGWVLPGLVVMIALGAVSSRAQESGNTPVRKASNPARRVPPYFGQVGLTIEQREKVYTAREKYAERIADLKKQITDAQAEELAECQDVLTDSQKQLLKQLRAGVGRRGQYVETVKTVETKEEK